MSRFATTDLPSIAETYGVTLPASVVEALARYRDVRSINPNPRPLADFARPVLSAPPAKREKVLVDGIAAHAAERDRPAFVRAVISAAESDVLAAVTESQDEIVAAFFAAPAIAEAGRTIAEHAPTVPVATPRSPSLDRTSPPVVASVALITGAWNSLDALVRTLSPILPAPPAPHIGPALLISKIDYTSEEQTWAVVNAVAGRKDSTVSSFAASLPTVGSEDRRRGERIPAVALAHISGVELALPTSRAEYDKRCRAFTSATRPGRWRPIVQQTHTESWVATY